MLHPLQHFRYRRAPARPAKVASSIVAIVCSRVVPAEFMLPSVSKGLPPPLLPFEFDCALVCVEVAVEAVDEDVVAVVEDAADVVLARLVALSVLLEAVLVRTSLLVLDVCFEDVGAALEEDDGFSDEAGLVVVLPLPKTASAFVHNPCGPALFRNATITFCPLMSSFPQALFTSATSACSAFTQPVLHVEAVKSEGEQPLIVSVYID